MQEQDTKDSLPKIIMGAIAMAIASTSIPSLTAMIMETKRGIKLTKNQKRVIPLGVRNRNVWVITSSGRVYKMHYIIAYRVRLRQGWPIVLINPLKWWHKVGLFFGIHIKIKSSSILDANDSIIALMPMIYLGAVLGGVSKGLGIGNSKSGGTN